MYIYNCPIIGSGTEYDPFRPSIADIPNIEQWEAAEEVPVDVKVGMRVKIRTQVLIEMPDVYLEDN